jgi:hypothetical protein
MRWAGYVAFIRMMRNVYISEGKRSLRRPRYRWEDNIKMYLGEIIGTSGGHSNQPLGSIKVGNFLPR